MAEGDSILRLARRLDAALAGSPLSVRAPGPRRPTGRPVSELDGSVLAGVESRGKHLVLRFSSGLVLHSHLGMKGSWELHPHGQRWRNPPRSAWIVLSDGETEAVNFNGTSLRIVRAAELARDPRLSRLGPDILGAEFTAARAARSMRRAAPGTALGEALLDQALVAGVGNIFKSEGCFAAAANPWQPLADLPSGRLEDVITVTRELMLAAVESGRQPQRVYRRSGMPCPRCRTPIRSRAQGDSARITYWCPRCQGPGTVGTLRRGE